MLMNWGDVLQTGVAPCSWYRSLSKYNISDANLATVLQEQNLATQISAAWLFGVCDVLVLS